MVTEKQNDKLSELQLGIRELFRILVPGAYVMALLALFAPQNAIVQLVEKGTLNLLVASLFLGLVGYALRVHERCFPYFLVFDKHRKPLNDAIIETISAEEGKDNVDLYKYFLETCDSPLRSRVHYFSSFYYMLVELSFISGVSAIYFLVECLRKDTSVVSGFLADAAFGGILLGIVIQVLLLCGLHGLRKKEMPVILAVAPGLLLTGGIITLSSIAGWPNFLACFTRDYLVPTFFLLAFAFERLGANHWNQIISEQIIFVRHQSKYLLEIADKQGKRV